jgi:hypothetical protein
VVHVSGFQLQWALKSVKKYENNVALLTFEHDSERHVDRHVQLLLDGLSAGRWELIGLSTI